MPGDNLTGKQLGEFLVEERIGQGAMATVYKAFQASVNRHVALKVIQLGAGQAAQEDFRRRFAREAELVARLEHIHILPIYGYGIHEDYAYLAMRWLRGGSLADTMRQNKLPLERAAEIFTQVARGLSYAHSKGIIHRDLKPSNIMLDDSGDAYLTDFGLAKITEGSGELTQSGTIVGTPAYMSPEQLRGDPLDGRSDIYSLGVILYNLAAHRLPFDTTNTDLVSVIYQHLEKPPTPPSEFNPELPPEVEDVILTALSKRREDRFDSAEEMARALNRALGRGTSDQMSPVTASRSSQRLRAQAEPAKPSRALPLAWVIGGVAILLLFIIGLLLLPQINLGGTVPQATILAGQSADWTDSKPTAAEISAAQRRLNGGFIAYLACTRASEYHAALAREISDLAAGYGLSLRIYDGNGDDYTQLTQVDTARSDGAKAIILCPLDITLLVESLVAVDTANLPLVIFGSNMPSYGGVLVGGTDYGLGLEPGRFAGRIIRDERDGQARVIILDFPDRQDIIERANGLEAGVKEFAPNVTIVGRYRGATPDFGRESVTQLIEDGMEFDVILSINDAGAFGAVEAMQAAGIDPASVFIASIDAEARAREYIQEGLYFRGSLESARTEVAITLVDAMVNVLAGSTVPENYTIPPGRMVTLETLAAEASPEPSGP
jgi:serine/threonine protein kinase/ABC-type sugar transport system substrate-binding protein